MIGLVTKNQNGYFTVVSPQGQFLSRSRGRLKQMSDILVGDRVDIELVADGAVIKAVQPRVTLLHRPPVANVEQLILTVAVKTPDIHRYTLDKMLLLAEAAGISPFLCINKAELDPSEAEKLAEAYKKAGYPTVCVSAATGEGINLLRDGLRGGIIAFSGPSGVGKSSLLNRLLCRDAFVSGVVSKRSGRGKNTTRHAELARLPDGRFVMDTPGYTSLSLTGLDEENLSSLFPDFTPYLGHCRFHDCKHLSEPDCAVKTAVENGTLEASRWLSYTQAVKEIRESVRI